MSQSEGRPIDVGLTSDNTQLSRPTISPIDDGKRDLSAYIRNATSDNTRRAYRSDLDHFTAWGGTIPCNANAVATYLADHATLLAVSTLVRRLATIRKAHGAIGAQSPTQSTLVQSTMKGIKRLHAKPQRVAKPLLVEDLFQILSTLGESPKDMRDRALLLLGFAGGFRRSELVALQTGDLEQVRQGLVVRINRSKTDQAGTGRKIGIPFARGQHCPVQALEAWTALLYPQEGPLFRGVTRHGHISDHQLSGEGVGLIIKERIARIGHDPEDYSGHSLRSGLATSAASAGVPSWKIRQQTGHTTDTMLSRYIRDGEMFTGNAAGALL
jgi:integrase